MIFSTKYKSSILGVFGCFLLFSTHSAKSNWVDFQISDVDKSLADSRLNCVRSLTNMGIFSNLAAVHEHLEMYGDEESLRKLHLWATLDGLLRTNKGSSISYEEFVYRYTLIRPFSTREGGLNDFLFRIIPLYAKVIGKNGFRIYEWSRLAVHAAAKKNITKLALRFSPGWLTQYSGMDWDSALTAIRGGLKKGLSELENQKMDLQLYMIATREMGGSDNSEFKRNVDFFLKNKEYFAAFDIAGSETLAPISNFIDELAPLIEAKTKDTDIHFTFHAGEEFENAPTSMTDAILAGANRLGHGIHGGRDEKLIELIMNKGTMVEVCPTSNCLLGVASSMKEHPLPYLLRSGFQPSLNTDDPLTFSVVARNLHGEYFVRPLNLHDEYANVFLSRELGGMGLSLSEIEVIKLNGLKQFDDFQPRNRRVLNELLH